MRQVAWTPLPPSNPPRPPTWLGLTAFPIFSSPVFFWFQIIFKTKEAKYKEIVLHMISRCWVTCTWPRLDLRGKEFLRRTNVLFAFPIDLFFRVWVTGDIMWSGREGRQLLRGEKSQSNATFVEMQPLKLEQPEDPCEERERSFSHRSFVQGEDDSCDTLWSVRAGQLDFVYVDFYSSGFY